MSLVNQMLKDLEQRRADLPTGDSLHGLRCSSVATAQRPQTWRRAGIALTVLAAAGIGWWLRPIAQPPAAADATAWVLPASAAPSVTAAPAMITAVAPAATVTQVASPEPPHEPSDEPSDGPLRGQSGEPQAPTVDAVSTELVATDVSQAEAAAFTPHSEALSVAATGTGQAAAPRTSSSTTAPPRMHKTLHELAPQDRAEQAYANALSALGGGDLLAAERALRTALTAWPQHAQSTETLAVILIQQTRLGEAEALLDTALTRMPQQANLAKLQARVLADTQRDGEALSVLDAARAQAKSDAEFHALYAALAQRQQQHAQAASAYRQALSLDPRQGAWWMGLGISLEQLNARAEAQFAYRKALSDTRLDARVTDYLNSRLAALGQG